MPGSVLVELFDRKCLIGRRVEDRSDRLQRASNAEACHLRDAGEDRRGDALGKMAPRRGGCVTHGESHHGTFSHSLLSQRFVDDVTKMTLPDESVDIVVDKARESRTQVGMSGMVIHLSTLPVG